MFNLSRRHLLGVGSAFALMPKAYARSSVDVTDDFLSLSRKYAWLDDARYSVALLSGEIANGTAIHLGHGLHVFDRHVARDNNNRVSIKFAGRMHEVNVHVLYNNAYQDAAFGRIASEYVAQWNLKSAVFSSEIVYSKDATTILVGWHSSKLHACLGNGIYPCDAYKPSDIDPRTKADIICNAETRAFAESGLSGGLICGEDGQVIGVTKASGLAQTVNGKRYITAFTPCTAVIEAARALFSPAHTNVSSMAQNAPSLPNQCEFVLGPKGWQTAGL